MSDNLRHTFDNTNKVTNTGLSVTYTQHFNGNYWEITRYAKKSYSFVGMDKSTAYQCAASKRTQYTRGFRRLDSSTIDEDHPLPSTVYAYECPTDIAPHHGDGDVWSVQIEVNEQDVVASATMAADPASLFAAENGRNYDEDAGSSVLSLDSAERTGTTLSVKYSCGIPDYTSEGIIVEIKTSESGSWLFNGVIGHIGQVPGTGDLFVRLSYGTVQSNVVKATDGD